MSASREKKARQERGADYVSPKEEKARKEQQSTRRSTAIFVVCAALFLAFVIGMAVYNSGVIQRKAAAVSVNGETYSAEDVAFYYYNTRSSLLSSAGSLIDTQTSLREQAFSGSEDQTWFDFIAEQAISSLAKDQTLVKAAKDAGFDGGEELESQFNETVASLKEYSASSGTTYKQYLKSIFGPLMTPAGFERNLRASLLASAYSSHVSDVSQWSEDDLTAAYNADPNAYSMVSYEYALYSASDYTSSTDTSADASADSSAESTETTADDVAAAAALAASQEAAAAASARVQGGESLETVAGESNATYVSSTAYYGTSEVAAWLFDDARKDGDVTVLDNNGTGTLVIVFHSKERADFHTVDVRHILVDTEDTANELLAQFKAGEQTEDAFAALANENSTDPGSNTNGGLYEGILPGQMVASFNDWCFDASRQPGDTGIVQTDYGYHIMYFVGSSESPYWQTLAAGNLSDEKLDAVSAEPDTQMLDGMKYIDN